jgi:hypothetical protein
MSAIASRDPGDLTGKRQVDMALWGGRTTTGQRSTVNKSPGDSRDFRLYRNAL